jgi:membrane-associated phospholipid phosphatase
MRKQLKHGAVFALLSIAITATSPTRAQDSTPANAPGSYAVEDRSVSLKKLPGNILTDQKDIWLFPLTLSHGKHIWPTAVVLGVTAGLIASDAHTAPPFRTTNDFHDFNTVFSGSNSLAIILAVPSAIYGVGLWRKDSYSQNSALLAAEALADGFIVDIPFKAVTGRRQPLTYYGNGPYTGSFFNGSHSPFHSGGFFSDHAMGSMAVATVLAHRYRQHRWVPYVAYGVAGAISFARVTTSNHFPGDVFFGGAMGFVIARYAVLPER